MNAAKRHEIFSRFQAANPKPTTELEYADTFQLLIAVILSAQATDRSVNLATARFFPEHGTPQGILAMGEEGL
ncbi:MAG: endonuclease III, partial [Alcaligenes aquatilis]